VTCETRVAKGNLAVDRTIREGRHALQPEWAGRLRGGLILGIGLALAAAASFAITYLVYSDIIDFGDTRFVIRLLALVDFILGISLIALIAWTLVRFFLARQRGSSGSRLHVRLAGTFSAIAIFPVIVVAVFSVITFNLSLESWFNERVQDVLTNSLDVAQAYEQEHRQLLSADALAMATDLNNAKPLFDASPNQFSEYLQTQVLLRSIDGAYVLQPDGTVLARAGLETAPRMRLPPENAFNAVQGRRPLILAGQDNMVIALFRLTEFEDAFLYIGRRVNPTVIQLLRTADESQSEYLNAEENRGIILLVFALGFTVVALLILLFAVWTGLSAAGRIVLPIGRIVGAAERVSEGDLSSRVEVGREDDEIATLGRAFNRMTGQLQTQRDELIEANRQYDRRRRFTEAVLAGVTAGVIGLDGQGRITIANRSALGLLNRPRDELVGKELTNAVPELAPLVNAAMKGEDARAQGEIDIEISGRTRNLTVQVTGEAGVGGETEAGAAKGFVVTFDDVTDLVSAQRMSAWADVARRIAHEIKNPLTPIQLSAERLRRKYKDEVVTDPHVFNQCTETIIRQVADIGQMVDEFSAFARMPEAVLKPQDIGEVVREAVFLQHVAFKGTAIEADISAKPVIVNCDARQLHQGLINVIKNAAEAVETRRTTENDPSIRGQVLVRLRAHGGMPEIQVIDNGCGLPKEHRHRLAEPYVTTREKGTGIGLAIVKKIMEDHDGELVLENAPPDAVEGWDRAGARIRLVFPEWKEKTDKTRQETAAPVGMKAGE